MKPLLRRPEPEGPVPPEPKAAEGGTEGGMPAGKIRFPIATLESTLNGILDKFYDDVADFSYRAKTESDPDASKRVEINAWTLGRLTIGILKPHAPEDADFLRRRIALIRRRLVGIDQAHAILEECATAISKFMFGKKLKGVSYDDGTGMEDLLKGIAVGGEGGR